MYVHLLLKYCLAILIHTYTTFHHIDLFIYNNATVSPIEDTIPNDWISDHYMLRFCSWWLQLCSYISLKAPYPLLWQAAMRILKSNTRSEDHCSKVCHWKFVLSQKSIVSRNKFKVLICAYQNQNRKSLSSIMIKPNKPWNFSLL